MTETSTSFSTLTMKVYHSLRNEILSGTLQPGTRLVRRVLSKRLGVSPIPITEALFRLEQDGLVESEPMYGSRVRALTIEIIRDDQVLREALETQAARLCAQHATPQQIEDLRADARQVDGLMATQNPKSAEGMELHLAFHLKLARYSGFPILENELRRVWLRRLMLLNWLNAAMFPVPRDWHQQLVAAIESHQPEVAEAKMRQHVQFNQEHDIEVLKSLSKVL